MKCSRALNEKARHFCELKGGKLFYRCLFAASAASTFYQALLLNLSTYGKVLADLSILIKSRLNYNIRACYILFCI